MKIKSVLSGLLFSGMLICGAAQAVTVSISADVNGFSSYFKDQLITWSGGMLTGTLDVTETAYQVNTSPNEITSRYAFTGAVQFDGVPVTFASSSLLVVLDVPNSNDEDQLSLNFYFSSIGDSNSLQLVALNLTKWVTDGLSPSGFFPNVDQLTYSNAPHNAEVYTNVLYPEGEAIFAFGGGSFAIQSVPIPEPTSLTFIGPALLWLAISRRRKLRII